MDTTVLHNTNREVMKEAFAADGESVMILPGAKVPVENKFLWKLAPDIVIAKPKSVSFGKKTASNPADQQRVEGPVVEEELKSPEEPKPMSSQPQPEPSPPQSNPKTSTVKK